MLGKITNSKKYKSGFTLVEVIVVLVILAILAAIAVPALTGYIDKAKKRSAISEARESRIALETLMNLQAGDGLPIPSAGTGGNVATDNYVQYHTSQEWIAGKPAGSHLLVVANTCQTNASDTPSSLGRDEYEELTGHDALVQANQGGTVFSSQVMFIVDDSTHAILAIYYMEPYPAVGTTSYAYQDATVVTYNLNLSAAQLNYSANAGWQAWKRNNSTYTLY
jgi:prepilin-type N-terminal cleavage/methylation domain-containing protein